MHILWICIWQGFISKINGQRFIGAMASDGAFGKGITLFWQSFANKSKLFTKETQSDMFESQLFMKEMLSSMFESDLLAKEMQSFMNKNKLFTKEIQSYMNKSKLLAKDCYRGVSLWNDSKKNDYIYRYGNNLCN